MSTPGREIADAQEALGHRFRDLAFLERALTHSSWSGNPSNAPSADNEQLELLGDAVLGLVVTQALLQRFPEWTVGRHSQARSQLVNANSLNAAAVRLRLGDFLKLGRGEEKSGLREQRDVLADTYEAVVAAIFLDAGLEPAAQFIHRTLLNDAFNSSETPLGELDHKSSLMEWFQARGQRLPEFRVIAESGPDHRKSFIVEIIVEGKALASGEGYSKKSAEQNAAAKALERIREENKT
ncbi:MAG TPA: ribonuclease III [Candidatus Nitrosotenuis sp.]|nr:ribonuclease III [Candidatus Nitrosotenuis sp.]